MNYELAKKLKDAGFPQVFTINKEIYELAYPDSKPDNIPYYGVTREDKEYAVAPTLSELIEACDEHFEYLLRYTIEENVFWKAQSNKVLEGLDRPIMDIGKSAEEAVANLWIALNTK